MTKTGPEETSRVRCDKFPAAEGPNPQRQAAELNAELHHRLPSAEKWPIMKRHRPAKCDTSERHS